jgi:HK97 family phage prohead protease
MTSILRKSLGIQAVQIKQQADSATFEGYASTFGNVDSYGDTIVKGAYAETLKKYGLPKMFFNHMGHDVPIGKWIKAVEDDYGLLLTGEFTQGNARAAEVRAALLHGTVDSLSIGYSLKAGDFDETVDGRTIRKVHRLAETSIVTFPADSFAQIDLSSVKSLDFESLLPACKTERDIERLLRDAGLGKWEAMALVSRAKTIFTGGMPELNDEEKSMAVLSLRLKQLEAATL